MRKMEHGSGTHTEATGDGERGPMPRTIPETFPNPDQGDGLSLEGQED